MITFRFRRYVMARQRQLNDIPFNDRLILFRYMLNLFGKTSLDSLAGALNHSDYEGLTESQNTRFWEYLDRQIFLKPEGVQMSRDELRRYDENICRYVRQIGHNRGGLQLKYFQYIALLFTEIYLDRYFVDRKAFAASLNAFARDKEAETLGLLEVSPFTPEGMNKLAFMSATGSGKTLIMHCNILQFLYYLKRAQTGGQRLNINQVIVLAPNEGMSMQHLEELALSDIRASLFEKERGFIPATSNQVIVIDMNKLKEEGKQKTVSVDSFEQNNLVLVDEAHRGLQGDVWYDYRTRLSQDGGFAFEYSATFKQALRGNQATMQAMMDEYGKSIIMDYSYKYFYTDGYGKDYRIYNLKDDTIQEQKELYLTGCLLSFYQQMKLYQHNGQAYAPFLVEKPLLVFVGNRVTATTSKGELTDVEEILTFIDGFVRNRRRSIGYIGAVLNEDTGLLDNKNYELFYGDFHPLKRLSNYSRDVTPQQTYEDMLCILFNADTLGHEPRLMLTDLRQVEGEIALQIGEQGAYFGVINIGDTATLLKNCEKKGLVTKTEEFVSESLFQAINQADSNIHVLIGSRKFTEGWNSWRVSTMGLINFAKGEGSQAIQLFGRGVRLKGYQGRLKRSSKLDVPATIPKDIQALETLTIFGVKAQYMEDFKRFLELEEMPTDKPLRHTLPVVKRLQGLAAKKLQVIRLPQGVSFKRQAARLLLTKPDEGLLSYLVKNRAVLDCRSKVQTIRSSFDLQLEATTQEHKLPDKALPFLDYARIFEELQQYKNEKTLYNLSIQQDKLKEILETDGWYTMLIPKSHIAFDSMDKLPLYTDFAIMALKVYIDKFFKYHREQWEAPKMSYQPLTEDDSNFVDEYTFLYQPQRDEDNSWEEMKRFLMEVESLLQKENGIPGYEETSPHGIITAFDFRYHLYAPLIHVQGKGLEISVSPVSLNAGEKTMVDLLKAYCDEHASSLHQIDLVLLRNKSKAGIGFFEADNFYPDYILWMNAKDVQYITFIDPKGLRLVSRDDRKVQFYATIKELEERLQPSYPDKRIVLNSFILSSTPSAELRQWWQMDKAQREARHVLCLDQADCIEVMMAKVLS